MSDELPTGKKVDGMEPDEQTTLHQTVEFSPTAPATNSTTRNVVPPAFQEADSNGPRSTSRYHTNHLHAEGGIGCVWLAHDTQFDRKVALKTLRPNLLEEDRVRLRFIQEARITGQLEHPGIVPVYELVEDADSGSLFYSMRFVHGRTLVQASRDYHRKRLAGEEEPLELVSLLSAFVTVCNTVAYAHSRGVVHRDLKGENVLLGDFGEVFILDWGVAKVLDAPEADEGDHPPVSEPMTNAVQTLSGVIVGTPAYMAPEQAEGRSESIGVRTDIYGLGAVLYEILTGRPPFEGSSTTEILAKVVRDPPPEPKTIWPDVPPPLEAACLRALAKDLADRFESATALGMEVQHWQETQRRQAVEDLRRSRERFELAVRGSQDGLWDWDLERNEVFFSPRWKSIIGYEDHELPNDLDEWVERLHPDERDRVLAANYAHINGDTSHYEYEYRLRHKDGSYRWILARGVALRDAEGKAYRMAGSHVDMTERKQMEQRLQAAEQCYRAVVDCIPDGILVVEADGTIRDCNARAAKMLEIAAGESKSLIDICGRVIDSERIKDLIRTDAAKQSRELIVSFTRDDGSQRQISFTPCTTGHCDATDKDSVVILLREV